MHFDTCYAGLSFKHTMPAVKTGRGVFRLSGMSVVPLLAGHFGADVVRHDRAVVGQVADRKAVRFEAARTGLTLAAFAEVHPSQSSVAFDDHRLLGLDLVAERRAAVEALGAETCSTPVELAARADIIETCVTTPADLARIIEGENGILDAGDRRATVLVDHSTTDIATTRRLADALAGQTTRQSAMTFVDAPVSGGPAAAEAGTLAIMAGGEEAAITTVRPVMEHLGRFTHMGPVTAGQLSGDPQVEICDPDVAQ